MTAAAETVLVGGRVWTPGWSTSRAGGVAVRDGRILAVDRDDGIRRLADARTEVIELDGQLVVPSFQDAHVHPIHAGLNRARCDLSDLSGAEDHLDAVAGYAAAHPAREWILGGGWSMDAFPGGTPTAEALDAVIGDRPAFLVNRDGHGAWVNTRALALAGVTTDTPDPRDGRIERDPTGRPTGTLHEGAMDLVADLVPAPTEADLDVALLEAQDHLHTLGITAWQDAIVGETDTKTDTLDVYRRAAERGALTARVVGALWWDRHRGEEQLEELIVRRRRGSIGRFRAGTVKIMADGVCENLTAAMLYPYLDEHGAPTAGRGISFVAPQELARVVRRLDEERFQVHVHAIGDRAVREALDAFAAVDRRDSATHHRHHIAHLQVIHPDDLPRFAALGVTANAQPLWAVNEPQMTELTVPRLGPARSRRQYPWRSLATHGARLAFGSDWPVTSADPLWGIHVAVNRTAPPGYATDAADWPPFLPDERIDLTAALRAYTEGAAHVNHLDGETAALVPGRLADLAVLEPDPFTTPADELGTVSVRLTTVGGVVVYERIGRT